MICVKHVSIRAVYRYLVQRTCSAGVYVTRGRCRTVSAGIRDFFGQVRAHSVRIYEQSIFVD